MDKIAKAIGGLGCIFGAFTGIFAVFAGFAKRLDAFSGIFKFFSVIGQIGTWIIPGRWIFGARSAMEKDMDEAKTLFAEVKEMLKDEEFPPGRPKHGPVKPVPSGARGTPWLVLGIFEDLGAYDEVWPGIFIGKGSTATETDLYELKRLGITHVLNAAHGKKFAQIDVDPQIYAEAGMEFLGVPAMDIMTYKMDKHFEEANGFIRTALRNEGRVFVHCHQGRSRSAALVLAYLLLTERLTLVSALRAVRAKRRVTPNDGFIRQLCRLQVEMKTGSFHQEVSAVGWSERKLE